jgi:hypothetical protein
MRRQKFAHQPLCEMCLSEGRVVPAGVVHHRVEHHSDKTKFFCVGADDLQSLCRRHHETIHGRIIEPEWTGTDGWPISKDEQQRKAQQQTVRMRTNWEDDDDASVIALCNRIGDAIASEPSSATVIRALLTVLTRELSLVCPDCRSNLAREIKQRIPDMLRKANAAARERERTQPDGQQAHMCH